MADEYKRGYSNGYNAGCRRSDKELMRVRLESRQVAERAERAEKAQGLGHCEDCLHWARGGDNCAWGYCSVPRKPGTPWGTWITDAGTVPGRIGQTAPRFGCVLFSVATDGSRANAR